jgi:hypothetical protein
MTIVEAANKLLEHFSKKDSFSMEDNYKDIILISEDPDVDKITFILALEDLERAEMIKSHTQGKKKIYILKKPFQSYEQSITISGPTSNFVAHIINNFCDKIKDKRDYCDAKSLTEKDIRNLAFLAELSSSKKEDLDE